MLLNKIYICEKKKKKKKRLLYIISVTYSTTVPITNKNK